VRKALAAARRAGFTTQWSTGDGLASLVGSPATVTRLFGVHLERYQAPGGRDFYAGNRAPSFPASFKPVVTGIGGLDDFEQLTPAEITPGGATPDDMNSFYDIQPLRSAGLDGSGETIVLPEAISPNDFGQLKTDLANYSAKFHLPPADMTMRADSSWAPFPSGKLATENLGEADLDVQVAHAMAPKAKLAVYVMGTQIGWVKAQEAAVKENPKGILSLSYGDCEARELENADLKNVEEQPWLALAAENMTAYVSTGDSGAYTCGQEGDNPQPYVSFPASIPVVVGVGGTTVMLERGGGYGSEIAWGDPLTQWGGGGGQSRLYKRPPWQKGAGMPSLKAVPARLLPDVSASANEAWNIVMGKQSGPVGGTSASAPFWAGITALIDQDLTRHGLRQVGVPLTALAWVAAHQSTYHAFHDITAGNNFYYPAGPGWDGATGWGTPDVANLDRALTAYIKAGGK
jgi:kumamolisin